MRATRGGATNHLTISRDEVETRVLRALQEKVAYEAYRRYVDAEQVGKAPVIDGDTGDQRFFMAFAQLWATFATPEYWKRAALTDPHSPGEFRVNGVLRNFDPWYETYNVTPDSKLFLPPDQRVRLW